METHSIKHRNLLKILGLSSLHTAFSIRTRIWAITVAIAISIWLIYASLGSGLDYFGGYRDLVLGADLASQDFLVFAPPWLATLLSPFVYLPDRIGFALFLAFSVFIIVFSTHNLNGHVIPVLLSAQLSWILWWGQIDGLAILGLALAWIAYKKKSWILMTAALLLALLKPQISLIPVLLMWWWMGKRRWKTLLLSAIFGIASLIIWGPWPIWIFSKIIHFTQVRSYEMWNTSLGLIAIPLFIPALFMPLKNRSKRLLAITATTLLVSPYMPYYSTLVLLCFPLSWWIYPFAFLGYLPNILGTEVAWRGITLLPILILLSIYQEPIVRYIKEFFISRQISLPYIRNILIGRFSTDEPPSTN
jgi:hypothetical protein